MIKTYLNEKKELIITAGVTTVIFVLLSFLAGTDIAVIVYGALIAAFLAASLLLVGFFRYRASMRVIVDIMNSPGKIMDKYPQCRSYREECYRAIIAALYERIDRESAADNDEYRQQEEYFTMWIHQIKTPISAMYLAMESDEPSIPIMKQQLFGIEEYVNMALSYTRMQNFSGDLVLYQFSLDKLIAGTVKKYSVMFLSKDVSLSITETGAEVVSDEKWLAFIFEQMFSNSIKYTKHGHIKIYREDDALVIEDTGIGINPEDLIRIFEKGYTGYSGRLDKKASGIGLYLAKKAADELNIHLSIASEVGKGTKASIGFGMLIK